MKRKFFLCMLMLCMLFLTACHEQFGMKFALKERPAGTKAYLLLKKEYAKEPEMTEAVKTWIERDSAGKMIYEFEEDGYVCAVYHGLADYDAMMITSPLNKGVTSYLRWDAVDEERLGKECEQYKTCKLLFYKEDTEELWTSKEFSLISSDHFGYPKDITYNVESDSFTVQRYATRWIYGHSLNWWWGELMWIGIPALAIGIIITALIIIVHELHNKRVPWLVIFPISVISSLPMMAVTLLTVLTSLVPYFKTYNEPFSMLDLLQPLLVGFPWILFLGVLLTVYLTNKKKNKG